LDRLSEGAPLPAIAVVTNCAPNHLDWHGSFAAYRAAKQRLVSGQSVAGIAVLNQYDGSLDGWRSVAAGTVRDAWQLDQLPPLAVLGQHNRQNAACAAAAASAAGVSNAAIFTALAGFRGLEHRLEFVAEVAGRHFYNDSKSTTPEATLAALAAVDRPVWLLAGGQSKGVAFAPLARAIVARAQGAALFGAARHELQACLQACDPNFNVCVAERLDEALAWCAGRAREGDAILLSPACASLDQFRDFTARGEMFCNLVRALAARAPG
jgi:UDP-N-acetylmuramoylalanine--D-glutamate ligase